MIDQLEMRPLSQEKLVAEVKGSKSRPMNSGPFLPHSWTLLHPNFFKLEIKIETQRNSTELPLSTLYFKSLTYY